MSIFSKIWKWITGNKNKIAETAVKVVDFVNQAVNSPATAKWVQFIPGDLDDQIVAKLKEIVPALAIKVSAANELLKIKGTPEEILAAYVNFLKKQVPELKAEQYNDLASEIIIALQDGKITFAEASKIAEQTYQLLKAKGVIK